MTLIKEVQACSSVQLEQPFDIVSFSLAEIFDCARPSQNVHHLFNLFLTCCHKLQESANIWSAVDSLPCTVKKLPDISVHYVLGQAAAGA